MKRASIQNHLRPYSIFVKRKTTINHAFASSIASSDEYDDGMIVKALIDLGLNPNGDLLCAYCMKKSAETWDHVYGLVKDQKYASYGHTIGNLVPCCKDCSSSKGNKNWRDFLREILDGDDLVKREVTFESYLRKHIGPSLSYSEIERICPCELDELNKIQSQILSLMDRAGITATIIRKKIKAKRLIDLQETQSVS